MSEEEADEIIQNKIDALAWEGDYFKISAANRQGPKSCA